MPIPTPMISFSVRVTLAEYTLLAAYRDRSNCNMNDAVRKLINSTATATTKKGA